MFPMIQGQGHLHVTLHDPCKGQQAVWLGVEACLGQLRQATAKVSSTSPHTARVALTGPLKQPLRHALTLEGRSLPRAPPRASK